MIKVKRELKTIENLLPGREIVELGVPLPDFWFFAFSFASTCMRLCSATTFSNSSQFALKQDA